MYNKKMVRRFLILSSIIFLIFFGTFNVSFARAKTFASAPADSQELIKQLQELIKSLQVQINELRSKLEIAKQDISVIKSEIQFNKFLSRGASGDEVRQLQEFLKQDNDIYPEGIVSGYFGPATEAAVKHFQEKHGIEPLGIIGPKTRAKLNELLLEGAGVSGVIPPGLLTAPGIQKKQKKTEIPATATQQAATTTAAIIAETIASATATTTITTTAASSTIASSAQTQTATTTQIQATSTLSGTISATPIASTPAITSTTALPNANTTTQTTQTTQSTSTASVASTTSQTTAAASATTTTATTIAVATVATTTTNITASSTVDTSPPIISSVSVNNISQTETTIVWTTNEPSDSLLQYGANQNYGQISQNSSLITSHTLTITGLIANTFYHYQIKSKDGSGNEAVSADYTFTTLAAATDTSPGTLKWVYTTFSGEYNLGAFAIAQDGTIYFGKRKITALNPNGTQKWFFNFDEDNAISASSPVIGSDGMIYVSTSVMLYAINSDGAKVWKFNPNASISAVSLNPDNTIYVIGGSYNNTLYALNSNGSLKWTFKTDSPSREIKSVPTIASDGTIYIGTADYKFDYTSNNAYKLYAINPDGTKKWEFMNQYNALINSFAIGSDGTIYGGVYVGGGIMGRLFAINPNGTLKWTFEAGLSNNVSAPTIGLDGTIYANAGGKLYAINPDGAQKWSFSKQHSSSYSTIPYQLMYSPTIDSDGILYVPTAAGYGDTAKLFAINPEGVLNWEFSVGETVFTVPAIAKDGTIYVWSSDGKIYAIRSSSMGLADSAWPKSLKNNRNTSNAGDPIVLSPAKSNLASVLFSLLSI